MARFIFSMQNILNMKEKLEEQANNNFAQANRSLQEALLMQKQCENRLEAGKQTLKEAMLENLKVGQIRRREDDVEIFRMYLRQQILVVKQKEKEVEEKIKKIMMTIPNIIDPTVHKGKDERENERNAAADFIRLRGFQAPLFQQWTQPQVDKIDNRVQQKRNHNARHQR